MPFDNLPQRSERAAPSFDDAYPENLVRYLDDVETLCTLNMVINEAECKCATLRYLRNIAMERLWKAIPEFVDMAKTYQEYKDGVLRMYPNSSEEQTYTMHDLDMIIGERTRIRIQSASDLGTYYCQFFLITSYLISKSHLGELEQSRLFLCGLRPELEQRLLQCLQLTQPTHCPLDPYKLSDLYNVGNFILMGGTPSLTITPSVTAPTSHADVKIEALTAVVVSLSEMFKAVIETQQSGGGNSARALVVRAPNPSRTTCNFCGVTGHFIRKCEIVAEYMRTGKCKRSTDGKVVLPSGAMVPCEIPGNWLHKHINEWHQHHPNQIVATQMIFEVAPRAPSSVSSFSESAYTQFGAQYEETELPGVYALRRGPARPGHMARANIENSNATEPTPRLEAAPHTAPETSTAANKNKDHACFEPVTHPFATDKQAEEPRVTKPGELIMQRHPDVAYTTTTKIYDEQTAHKVYERILQLPVTLTQRELLSLTPELCTQIADATIKCCIAHEPPLRVLLEEIKDPEADKDVVAQSMHMPVAFAATAYKPVKMEVKTYEAHNRYDCDLV